MFAKILVAVIGAVGLGTGGYFYYNSLESENNNSCHNSGCGNKPSCALTPCIVETPSCESPSTCCQTNPFAECCPSATAGGCCKTPNRAQLISVSTGEVGPMPREVAVETLPMPREIN